jgi:hypothetical protein
MSHQLIASCLPIRTTAQKSLRHYDAIAEK